MTYELKNGLTIVVGNDITTINTLPSSFRKTNSEGTVLIFESFHHSHYSEMMKALFLSAQQNTKLLSFFYKTWLYVTSWEVLQTYVEEYVELDFQLETRVVRFTVGKEPVEIDIDRVCRLVNNGREIR